MSDMLDVQPRRRLFSADEFLQMADAGVFRDDLARIELIEGEIVEMSPTGNPHGSVTGAVGAMFWTRFRGRAVAVVDVALRLSTRTVVGPDISLVPSSLFGAPEIRPSDVIALIEVSVSSLGFDRREKMTLYARAGISEYLIANVEHKELIAHREPSAFGYADVRTYRMGETFALAAFPDDPIPVAELFTAPV